MNAAAMARQRWELLAAREKMMVAGALALVGIAIAWLLLLAPALSTLRSAEQQHRSLDAQLEHMQGLQAQAQMLQAQPKQNRNESMRLLELAVRQHLGTTARMQLGGDRVTVTLLGTTPDALAQWLTQARVNARALPSEARLNRNAAGLWEGTVVLTLPPG